MDVLNACIPLRNFQIYKNADSTLGTDKYEEICNNEYSVFQRLPF